MPTITISRSIAKQEELVAIPKSEYEELLHLKKMIKIVKPTKIERKAIERGREEVRKRQYVVWSPARK